MVGFPSTGKRQNKRNLFKIGGEARSTVYVGNTGSADSGDGAGQAAADSPPPPLTPTVKYPPSPSPPPPPNAPLARGMMSSARHHDTGSDPENPVRGSPGYKRGSGYLLPIAPLICYRFTSLGLVSISLALTTRNQSAVGEGGAMRRLALGVLFSLTRVW